MATAKTVVYLVEHSRSAKLSVRFVTLSVAVDLSLFVVF